MRSYRDVRKDYISTRSLALTPTMPGSRFRDRKEEACREFDAFVAQEREIAVREYQRSLEPRF